MGMEAITMAKATKVTLGQWEGDPTALVQRDDGTMDGFLYVQGRGWTPGFTDEAFNKAVVLGPDAFKAMFPNVQPPTPG